MPGSASRAASLSGSVSDLTYVFGGDTFPGTFPAVNLTTEGTHGWIEYGTGNAAGAASTSAVNVKAAGNAISNGQVSGANAGQTLALNFREWSDGTPVGAIAAAQFDGNAIWGTSTATFAFDVAPDGGSETLRVYTSGGVSADAAGGTFTATLKDSLGNVLASYTDSPTGNGADPFAKLYTITFQSGTPTDVLSISYAGTRVGIDFATLQSAAGAPVVPTPAAATAGATLLGGLAARRRRRGECL